MSASVLVIAGLDPAIHANHAPSFGTVDPRIKSAGDEFMQLFG